VKRWLILPTSGVLFPSFGLLFAAVRQSEPPKPKVSNEPLTAEQASAYRAVLDDYTNRTNSTLNIGDKTYPLKESDRACSKGSPSYTESSIIHDLDSTLAFNRKFVLVDPDR
jgi:hypothetical protein